MALMLDRHEKIAGPLRKIKAWPAPLAGAVEKQKAPAGLRPSSLQGPPSAAFVGWTRAARPALLASAVEKLLAGAVEKKQKRRPACGRPAYLDHSHRSLSVAAPDWRNADIQARKAAVGDRAAGRRPRSEILHRRRRVDAVR